MIILLEKLKINKIDQFANIIELIILELTPIPSAFHYYYIHLYLIQYQD
jgi:hypothetical protein